jgi:hypothetical protein
MSKLIGSNALLKGGYNIMSGSKTVMKQWGDIKKGDVFLLKGDMVEVVDYEEVEDNGTWLCDKGASFTYSDFMEGSVVYVGVSTSQIPDFEKKCEGAHYSAKYKSSTYNTEYLTFEDAIVDLLVTDYFDVSITFRDGLFGEMLFNSLTMEQKRNMVKLILGIEST